jgi:Domain of unknown function (DUF305)
MSGRIKLLDANGTIMNQVNEPQITTTKYHHPRMTNDTIVETYYDVMGSFDQNCSSYGLDKYQLPYPECPRQFICQDVDDTTTSDSNELGVRGGGSDVNELYAQCHDANNCMMLSQITTGIPSGDDEISLFIHQMIPHHQNAVNMAKNLLRLKNDVDVLACSDIANEGDSECLMEALVRDVINGQNHEIQIMLGYLQSQNITYDDSCSIDIETINTTALGSSYNKTSGSDDDVVKPSTGNSEDDKTSNSTGGGGTSDKTVQSTSFAFAATTTTLLFSYCVTVGMTLFITLNHEG